MCCWCLCVAPVLIFCKYCFTVFITLFVMSLLCFLSGKVNVVELSVALVLCVHLSVHHDHDRYLIVVCCFFIRSVRFDKVFSAMRSFLVRLSDMRLRCKLFISSSNLSMEGSSDEFNFLGGVPGLFFLI